MVRNEPLVDATSWCWAPNPMEPVKEPSKSMVDKLIEFLIGALIDILLALCKGLFIMGIHACAHVHSLTCATLVIIKFITIAILIMVRNLVAWVLMAEWLENHQPAFITDRIHSFLHQIGHRGDIDNETHHQTMARLKEEKANMAQEYIILYDSKQRTEDELKESRNEVTDLTDRLTESAEKVAGLQTSLTEHCKEKEWYRKFYANLNHETLIVEAREADIKEKEKHFTKSQEQFDSDKRKLEFEVGDLEYRLARTNARDDAKISILNRKVTKQEHQIQQHERLVAEAKQEQVAYIQRLNERFRKYSLACKETQAKLNKKIKELQAEIKGLHAEANGLHAEVNGLQAEVNGLQADIKDHERGAEEMGEQVATDMLVKEELEEELKEQKTRAGAAEQLVNGLAVINTELQGKLGEQKGELTALQAKQSSIDVVTAWADAAEAKITTLEAAKADLEEQLAAAEGEAARANEELEMGSGCLLM
ncbi:MAG: hypothetical protein Q9188_001820 [Gyalolechia gomerana]